MMPSRTDSRRSGLSNRARSTWKRFARRLSVCIHVEIRVAIPLKASHSSKIGQLAQMARSPIY